MTVSEELAVIQRVLGGETDAFAELVADNQQKVYNLALRLTGSEHDALDVSQEAFLKAYTGLGNFRGESRFSVWLYRMTYNLCIDLLRKKQRCPSIPLSSEGEDGEQEDMEIPDMRHLPENEVERREMLGAIRKAVDGLPPRFRQILVMREVTGMSYAEIAATLYISEGTVKSRLSRARRSLIGILIKNGTFSPSFRQKETEEANTRG